MSYAIKQIQTELITLSDPSYQKFAASLMPTVDPQKVLGVRMPVLRAYAKRLAGSEAAKIFLSTLPHTYYEENNLHMVLLEGIQDPRHALKQLEAFLPYVDNWATCDSFCPKILRKHPQMLLGAICPWLRSDHVYTARYGLVRLTAWYLQEPLFSTELLSLAASVKGTDYYLEMAVAWFFSMALAKQWESTLPYFHEERLSQWIHNKALQKAIESYQLTPGQKDYLRTLKRKTTL